MEKTGKKPADAKPIIDVEHPGKSAPSGNSKSVIVNSRPLLKDPMVVTDNAAVMPDKESAQDQPAKTKSLDIATPQPATELLLETEAPDETAEQTTKPEPEPEKVVEPPPSAAPADEPEAAPEPQPEAVEDDEEKDQPLAKGSAQQLEAEAATAAKHQADVEKLADSEQYYLPINTVEKRRSRRFVAIGIILSLLLVVAWADIALDAGLVHVNSVKPVTHFFSN